MLVWATAIALALGAFFYVVDPSTVITSLAELAAVIALFALVCAAEIFNEPKG